MLGPTVWAFTELGRKDVKVDILISRLMGLHVQQFAFKLTNLAQMSLVLQFITGQVIFLSNGRQWLKARVNYRFWMCCWKPIKRSIKKWKTAFPRMYFTAASGVMQARLLWNTVCCSDCLLLEGKPSSEQMRKESSKRTLERNSNSDGLFIRESWDTQSLVDDGRGRN